MPGRRRRPNAGGGKYNKGAQKFTGKSKRVREREKAEQLAKSVDGLPNTSGPLHRFIQSDATVSLSVHASSSSSTTTTIRRDHKSQMRVEFTEDEQLLVQNLVADTHSYQSTQSHPTFQQESETSDNMVGQLGSNKPFDFAQQTQLLESKKTSIDGDWLHYYGLDDWLSEELSTQGFQMRQVTEVLTQFLSQSTIIYDYTKRIMEPLVQEDPDSRFSFLERLLPAPRKELTDFVLEHALDWLIVNVSEKRMPKAFSNRSKTATTGITVLNFGGSEEQVAKARATASLSSAQNSMISYITSLGFARHDVQDASSESQGKFVGTMYTLCRWHKIPTTPAEPPPEMDAEEREEIVSDEKLVLESIFDNAVEILENQEYECTVYTLSIDTSSLENVHPRSNLAKQLQNLQLKIFIPFLLAYPTQPPFFILLNDTLLPQARIAVMKALMEYAATLCALGEAMIHEVFEFLKDNLATILKDFAPAEEEKKKKEKKVAAKPDTAKVVQGQKNRGDKNLGFERNIKEELRLASRSAVAARQREEEEAAERKKQEQIAYLKNLYKDDFLSDSTDSSDTETIPSKEPEGGETPVEASSVQPVLVQTSPAVMAPQQDVVAFDDALVNSAMQQLSLKEAKIAQRAPTKPKVLTDAELAALDTKNERLFDEYQRKIKSGPYKKMQAQRSTLPAFTMREQLLEKIAQNQVVVVSGETGCGKSTQVPQFILEEALASKRGGSSNIIVTQPRRLAAIALAERVSDERASKLGQEVGYQIRLEVKKSKATKLLYCTTGILLRMLENENSLSDLNVSHIVVDEVHERSLDSDFLLIILKDLIMRKSKIKIVLMSATLNADLFLGYFASVATTSTISIPGRTFPVDCFWLADAIEFSGYEMDAKSPYLDKKKAKDLKKKSNASRGNKARIGGYNLHLKAGKDYGAMAYNALEQHDNEARARLFAQKHYVQNDNDVPDDESGDLVDEYSVRTMDVMDTMALDKVNYDLIAELCAKLATSGQHGSGAILIFFAGMGEILEAIKAMRNHAVLGNPKSFLLVPLHSALSSDDQRLVFKKVPPEMTKIVLSTNIAETSLTIDDVTCVIDSGKMKETKYDAARNMSSLVETWVSLANAKQRQGRAGRVQRGVCFRMYTPGQEAKMSPQQVPEILRVPLESIVLRIKILGLGSVKAFLRRALEPPTDESVFHVLDSLQRLQALEVHGDSYENEDLTPLGYHLASLPVEPNVGKMMIYASIFRCIDPVLTIAASLSFRSPFSAPFDLRDEADEIKRNFIPEPSDHLTVLKAYDGWLAAKAISNAAERQYLRKNFLNYNTLKMIRDLKRNFASLLSQLGFVRKGVDDRKMRRLDGDGVKAVTGLSANKYSSNNKLVSAVLVAGLYPNVVRITEEKFYTRLDGEVFIHPSSALFKQQEMGGFSSHYLIYHEKVKTSKIYLRDCSMVTPYALLLLSGGKVRADLQKNELLLDEWLPFNSPPKTAVLVKQIQSKLADILRQKILEPSVDLQHLGEVLVDVVAKLLEKEGLQAL